VLRDVIENVVVERKAVELIVVKRKYVGTKISIPVTSRIILRDSSSHIIMEIILLLFIQEAEN